MSAMLISGQDAEPEGPSNATMMHVLHHAFQRDLALFVVAAQRTPLTDLTTWAALHWRWNVFALLLDGRGHQQKSHAWLSIRSMIADVPPAENGTIAPLLRSIRDDLDLLAHATGTGERDRLVSTLESASSAHGHLLEHVGRDTVSLLQQCLVADDWTRLERKLQHVGLAPGDLRKLLPWSVQGLPETVAAELIRDAGLPFRLVLQLGRCRYSRIDTCAFTYVLEGVGP